MRALVDRRATSGAVVAAAGGALAFAAFFFARGTALSSLVWIGAFAVLATAVAAAAVLAGALPAPRLDGAGAGFLAALFGLAIWVGATTFWSASPESSWQYTNRTLVYAAFALLGALAAALLQRPAETLARGSAVLLSLLLGWALLAKCVPSLYSDYGRLARLRAPVDYWNELALLAAVAVPVALWLAARRPAAGTVLLYGAGLTVLLTYSRFGIALACLAAVAGIVLAEDRVAGLAAVGIGGAAAAALFGAALALPGITKDGQPHVVRAHDGWIFALAVVAGGAIVAGSSSLVRRRLRVSDATRRRIERTAAIAGTAVVIALVVVAVVFAGRIWHSFANPVSSQIASNGARLGSLNSSNRWSWWQEAWHAFLRHPGGGTGAGTFQITDAMLHHSPLRTTEPHNVPLQFLSETGVVGLLLFVAAAVAAVFAVTRARLRARGTERAARTALAIGAAAFLAHLVVDTDWDYIATCGPLLFVVGALVVRGSSAPSPARRPLLAAVAVLFSLGAIYSLAAPWLAARQLATATTIPQVKRAHAYDPLSTDVLTEWAAFEEAVNPKRAEQLYRDAVTLEPQNTYTWYDLGDFFWDFHRWTEAYLAYSRAWQDDHFGPAGTPCGRLDQARHKVLKVWPPSCPGGRPAATH
ncbi:MAG TPA: O-antigen ligase family protein [Gaiellaceae bacterium]|nr:O-antigen ligase family protein [Gaiellaceae bacterium]